MRLKEFAPTFCFASVRHEMKKGHFIVRRKNEMCFIDKLIHATLVRSLPCGSGVQETGPSHARTIDGANQSTIMRPMAAINRRPANGGRRLVRAHASLHGSSCLKFMSQVLFPTTNYPTRSNPVPVLSSPTYLPQAL